MHFNWIIGFSGTRDVFFCCEQIQQRDAGNVLWQNSSKSIVFLVVAIFAKTRCHSLKFSSPLRDVSHLCDVSIMDLSKMIRATFQAFYDHFSHETYKHHASTVTCSESKWKNPPGKNDHSRQKQTTHWKYFLYQSSYWGMSTLAVPQDWVLFTCNIAWYKHLGSWENTRVVLLGNHSYVSQRYFCSPNFPCV